MAKIQTIKRRIKSVSNTRQITKAMELVSASKMRRAQEAMVRTLAYVTTGKQVLGRLADTLKDEPYALFAIRPIKTRLIILVTSDRGLAGAYNSNLFRLLVGDLKQNSDIKTKLIVIGQKGIQFASKLNNVELEGVYPNWPTSPSSVALRPIVRTVLSAYEQKSVDSVQMLYTKPVSLLKQQATLEAVLPVNPSRLLEQTSDKQEDLLFEPSPRQVLEEVVPRLVEIQIFQAALEAIAAEQAMRMLAMTNASDNAEGIIDDLTLTYNGARQAAITQELAEISAGAQAII